MGLQVGNDLKLYYNTGTDASPTWAEIKLVGDVTVNINCNEAEVDLRISNWVLNLPAKLNGSLDVSLAYDGQNSVYDAMRAAALNRTQYQFASADGDIDGGDTEFFKSFCFFSSFPWSQPTQELSSGDASLSFGYKEEDDALVEPSWAAASGSP